MPLQVRVLRAPNCGHLGRVDLLAQVVQIVPHGHQIGLGRKLVSGVSPVGVGKGTQLTGVYKGFQLSLEGFIVLLGPWALPLTASERSAVFFGSAERADTTSTQSRAHN